MANQTESSTTTTLETNTPLHPKYRDLLACNGMMAAQGRVVLTHVVYRQLRDGRTEGVATRTVRGGSAV